MIRNLYKLFIAMIDKSTLHSDINANIQYKCDINLCKTSHIISYFCFMLPRYIYILAMLYLQKEYILKKLTLNMVFESISAYSEVYNTSNIGETNDNTSIFVKSLYCLNKRCAFVARKHVLVQVERISKGSVCKQVTYHCEVGWFFLQQDGWMNGLFISHIECNSLCACNRT